jgi:hypothetical protein
MTNFDPFSRDRKLRKLRAPPLLFASVVLMLSAIGLLVLAKYTPWHTDSNAYFANLSYAEMDQKTFYANLHRYETHKWLYADLGYAAAAWSVALWALWMIVNIYGWHAIVKTNTDLRVVMGLTLVACVLMLAGLTGQSLQQMGRWQVPDGSTGPMNAGIMFGAEVMLIGTLVFLAANIAPLFWRPVSGQSLFPTRPIGRGLIVSVLYAPFLLLPCFLLLASFYGPGGWGMSVGAVIAIWLILNARSLAMSATGRRRA